jgi:hypothetical protein
MTLDRHTFDVLSTQAFLTGEPVAVTIARALVDEAARELSAEIGAAAIACIDDVIYCDDDVAYFQAVAVRLAEVTDPLMKAMRAHVAAMEQAQRDLEAFWRMSTPDGIH